MEVAGPLGTLLGLAQRLNHGSGAPESVHRGLGELVSGSGRAARLSKRKRRLDSLEAAQSVLSTLYSRPHPPTP